MDIDGRPIDIGLTDHSTLTVSRRVKSSLDRIEWTGVMRKLLLNIVIAIVGVIGILIGLLPDLKPDLQSTFLLQSYQDMEVGYKKLIEYYYISRDTRGNSEALKKSDAGYAAIYNLLRSLEPVKIPRLDTNHKDEGNDFGTISIDKNEEWAGGATVMNRIVSIKTLREWRPICEIRDLRNIIDIKITRYFSRIGFGLTFVSIIASFMLGIKK